MEKANICISLMIWKEIVFKNGKTENQELQENYLIQETCEH